MPVLFACPYCKTETIVDDHFAGHSGPCVMCGRVVTVPQAVGRKTITGNVSQPSQSQSGNVVLLMVVVIGSLLAAVAMICGIVAIVAPAVSSARVAAQKVRSGERLELIASALEQYHVQYGSYPPAQVFDASGKKAMHSWRVLILPQLGHHNLYRQYDFNQPWDSPTNMMLVTRMPDEFAAPGDDAALASHETSYVAIIGPSTLFPPGGKSRTRSEISDGLGETLMVGESAGSGICWMEPKDLELKSMSLAVNSAPNGCLRSSHPHGASVVFADGKAHFIPNDYPSEFLEALITVNKGDTASLDLLDVE